LSIYRREDTLIKKGETTTIVLSKKKKVGDRWVVMRHKRDLYLGF